MTAGRNGAASPGWRSWIAPASTSALPEDSIQDPWYPLGNGNILRILDAGLHICHMLGYDDLQRCLDFVTDNSARALCLGDNYGLAEGRPANLLILDAENDYEAVRRQARVLTSIRHGKVIFAA